MKEKVKNNRASRSGGKMTEVFLTPETWAVAEKIAKARGQTVQECVIGALQEELDGRSRTIVVSPNNARRAREIADLLEVGFEDYVNDLIDGFLDTIHGSGGVGEQEVSCRVFDSKEDLARIIRRVDAFDKEVGRAWVISEDDGKFSASY